MPSPSHPGPPARRRSDSGRRPPGRCSRFAPGPCLGVARPGPGRFRRTQDRSTPSRPSSGSKDGSQGVQRDDQGRGERCERDPQVGPFPPGGEVGQPRPRSGCNAPRCNHAGMAGTSRPAASGSGKTRQAAGSSRAAGKISGAATRPPASARPFCAETSAMTCINGCGRVAASRIDSRTIANGSARLPCDWQRMASTAPAPMPSFAPPRRSVRHQRLLPHQPGRTDPDPTGQQRSEEAPSAADAGRPRLPRPLPTGWPA